ncbi:hypothetical protein CBQ26_02885 [Deinococcus indicus]|uniref:Uncharacterized protein n=1 Tax=Deinococcus indicus TaxID=223556 RepID=A0A246BNM2_9DEIO|nr:hypothetical protein [Deinococcus indicus]OWL97266.1 hypothetical protein CBQ26_02885 [Deinococcus indicus]GHG32341.1 hypothetical protein GCM10017784_27390 [Deinococcus indicus]
MSDLDFLLTFLAAGASLYSLFTLRSDARRLHYRDRRGFWLGVLPLLLGVAVTAALLLLPLLTGVTLNWAPVVALAVAVAVAGLTWWVDLEPGRVLRVRATRR